MDGLIPANNGALAIFFEVKQSQQSRPQDIKHLKKYVAETESGIGLLVNQASAIEKLADRIWAVPASWLFR